MDSVPPQQLQSHKIDLVSVDSSKILGVSLYTGRAEITRSFDVTLKEGSTSVNILGLPNVLENESLRVEGRGAAIIQDVSISEISTVEMKTSPVLEELKSKKRLVSKALSRCKVASKTLKDYMYNAGSKSTDIGMRLQDIIDQYNESGKKLDRDEVELEKELQAIEESIEAEKKELHGNMMMNVNPLLKKRVSINLLAETETQVKVLVTYAVGSATWDPLYDVRVNTQSEEKPTVTIVYKAAITQITGESWDGVPLTLETASPNYDVSVPLLQPWSLSVLRLRTQPPQTVIIPHHHRSRSRSRSRSPPSRFRRARRHSPSISSTSTRSLSPPRIPNQVVSVTSKGDFSATFSVPSLINIPGDGRSHNVIVAELKLDAILSWIAAPKVDRKVHLQAKIKNDSEYTLVAGSACIYVDGSFVAKTNLPVVSPRETFDCALGVDPSIRINYHPISKKGSQSGLIPFTQKTTSLRYSQRMTICNTKTKPVQLLTIRDVIPVSDDERIAVKLINPALPTSLLPSKNSSSDQNTKASRKESSRASFSTSSLRSALSNTTTAMGSIRIGAKGKEEIWKEMEKLPGTLKVSKSVLVQWAGVEEPNFDESAVGREGRINWICSLQPGETVNCTAEWEVSFPAGVEVVGL
ncbi:hypothetical protein VKT23_018870 [Stygiomarasmius scandens]|uniref:Mucoidy inhibitor A n=1 Tax=Marasmiellus scandens TaxID=2682957 RepID=A0ABR1IRV8_9AGAR